MKILVINAGSSSLKFQLIDMDDESVKAKGLVERIGIEGTHFKQTVLGTDKVIEFTRNMKDHTEAISAVLSALTDKDNGAITSLDEIGACGHRVLHGGETFKNSVLVTEETMKGIEELVPLGPLHQPANIAGIKACQAVMPNKPNVAVFDTAFHQTMPKKAFLYGVPYEYYTSLKVRRYGFHGTSHRFIAGETPKFLGKKPEDCKFIICHLGNGSSLSAIVGGKVVDTSMGLTPLDGFIMGTRCGGIDPSIVTFLMNKEGLTADEMSDIMNKKSGFLGVSGISSDCRDLIAAAGEGNHRAQLALDMLVYQIKKFIGGYAAAMGGVDAIAFTGGIGEHDADSRAKICHHMDWLGIRVDTDKNANAHKQNKDVVEITAWGAKVRTLVIETNEELMIARDTKEVLGNEGLL